MFGKKDLYQPEQPSKPKAEDEVVEPQDADASVEASPSDTHESTPQEASEVTPRQAFGSANVPAVMPSAPKSESTDIIASQVGAVAGYQEQQKRQAFSNEKILEYTDQKLETDLYKEAKLQIIEQMVGGVNFAAIQKLPKEQGRKRVSDAAELAIHNLDQPLTAAQMELLRVQVMDELMGLGPLEVLLQDPDISDVMINTAKSVYVEKAGKVYPTDVTFINEEHLIGIIQRIVSRVGRRVDESSPMVDARLEDGSRFNAIIPPLALDGCLVSIRKFKQDKMRLSDYVNYGSISPQMHEFLKIAARCRLNIIISGGTGSGKTTLLNALSGHIDVTERVITIEDAAEIQMHQPHVLRLETRPASTEGTGEVTQRQLVKNALRMRPDRIILGEIRGDEVIDVLSAMNTGHDGSLATIHSNSPRDCLARIENLVGMSGVNVTDESLKYQISSAVQLVLQLSRMRDGSRRITHIEEIVGLNSGVIATQTLFKFRSHGINAEGKLEGEYECSGLRPHFLERAEYFGLDKELLASMGLGPTI